ncbi:MAG: BMP family lipoprotein [Fusobacteriaceae bacterium]
MKKIILVFSMFALLFTSAFSKDLKVGLILAMGGLGDKSFNDSAYAGLQKAEKDFSIKTKYVEPNSWADDASFINEFVDNKFDLIIATSYTAQEAMEEIAKKNPETKFAIIDTEASGDNIASLVFNEEEGSFLVGAVAAMMSQNEKIGFIGGLDIPLINNFRKGYEAGAKYINPNMKFYASYIGGDSPFSDPLKGKEQSISMINQGVDVIYHAAGNTGNGVMEALKINNAYGIGVDSDQDFMVPGKVLTSMMKNVDNAVYDIISETAKGSFKGGVHHYGIKENGVGTTDFKYTKDIIGKENLAKIEEIKNAILSGNLKVKN